MTPTTAAVIAASAAAQPAVPAQPLDVGCAEEDPQKTGSEGDPGGDQRAEQRGPERRQRGPGLRQAPKETDELNDLDERTGRRLFGQPEAVEHLAGVVLSQWNASTARWAT